MSNEISIIYYDDGIKISLRKGVIISQDDKFIELKETNNTGAVKIVKIPISRIVRIEEDKNGF